MKGALRITCWQGRGSFESSRRPCLSSLTAGARWWPSRSPCRTHSGSHHCLHRSTEEALYRDHRLALAVISPHADLVRFFFFVTVDCWATAFILHSPIVEFPEAPPWHDNGMWGIYLRVELWVIFNIGVDLEEKGPEILELCLRNLNLKKPNY